MPAESVWSPPPPRSWGPVCSSVLRSHLAPWKARQSSRQEAAEVVGRALRLADKAALAPAALQMPEWAGLEWAGLEWAELE
jgi:hypothetical protein